MLTFGSVGFSEPVKYRILGACNPEQTHEGLQDELLLGTLRPCNVVVYETDDGEVGGRGVDSKQLTGGTDTDVGARPRY